MRFKPARFWICTAHEVVYNLRLKFNLDELSKALKVTKHHLAREFKRYTGKTIVTYHTELKISKACERLKQTDENVAQISRELQFSSPYYFSLVFKKYTGFSPSEYRKIAQKKF